MKNGKNPEMQISAEGSNEKTGGGFLFLSALLGGSFLYCYWSVFAQLLRVWRDSEIYSYGVLIPLISAYIVWTGRHELRKLPVSPNALCGVPVMAAGLSALMAGRIYGTSSLPVLSLLIMIAGLTLFVFGKRLFRALLFPIGYLVFTVPFWDRLISWLQMPLQNLSAKISSFILNAVGIPVYNKSIYLELPNMTLQVARQCSGVNNLIAVIAIYVPLAYITLRSWPRRLILLIGALAISILYNGIRIALIAWLAYSGITSALHGPFHIFQALYVSFAGFIGLFLLAWLLSKGEARPENPHSNTKPEAAGQGIINTGIEANGFLFITASLVMIAAGSYLNFF